MILPKQIDINKSKAQERKSQIDEGLVLARRVDELRQMRLQMETNFEIWRQSTSKSIQTELDTLTDERDDMAQQVIEARRQRDFLLQPLNQEQLILAEEKDLLIKEKNEFFLEKERINSERLEIQREKDLLVSESNKISDTKINIEQEKAEILKLKKDSQRDRSFAQSFKEKKEREYEKTRADISQLREQYEVGLKTIEVREKQVEEKEVELITRENDLTRRIKNLQRVEGLK